jgi:anti-sigma B factor antagonist
MLKVTIRKVGGIVVIRCVGRIVAGEDFCAVRDGIGQSGENRFIVVNLAEVDAIDAAGLGLLVSLHTSPGIAGVELKLMNTSERTRELLTLTRLDSVLEICSPRHAEWLGERTAQPGGRTLLEFEPTGT